MRGGVVLAGSGDGTLSLTRLRAKAAACSQPDGLVGRCCSGHGAAITACQLIGTPSAA
jgi:hypothetical protein